MSQEKQTIVTERLETMINTDVYEHFQLTMTESDNATVL